MDTLNLAPRPRQLTPAAGELRLAPRHRIVLAAPVATALLPAARRLQSALRADASLDWPISASDLGPAATIGATLRLLPERIGHPQGYRLEIGPGGILVEGGDAEGVFYGVCTLAQILAQRGATLPALVVEDWPDFPVRGVMLDVSRDRVPTMDSLYVLVDRLAGWKINQLQLYTEHTFAYAQHPAVWAAASPFTGDEILALDAYCRERFVELVPNQNSFGHMARWLSHPAYAGLAETHAEFDTPWGIRMQGPFSLCPEDPGSLALVRSLLDELLPHFTSLMVNVGCDETIDLGQGRSRAACDERGRGRVYLDFLQAIYRAVQAHGRTMQYWGDIVLEHPELIAELPGDAIALNWGYEANHPFAVECERFAVAGVPFYVCPGTSSWNTLAGRSDNALGNLRAAAEHGLRHGAIGYLITDWGDRGHWQAPPISELPLLAGAAYSWAWEANRDLDSAAAASLHAFRDPSGASGRVAYELGNVYTLLPAIHNSSPLFWTLQLPLSELRARQNGEQALSAAMLDQARQAIERAIGGLAAARIDRPDAVLVGEEFAHTAALMRHACRRAALALEPAGDDDPDRKAALYAELSALVAEQRRLWLARSRPGGLDDSIARFNSALADYAPGGYWP